jgi:hypothetical protein
MPGLKDGDLPVCGVVGVHPSVIGMVSSVQVSEAVRCIIGQKPRLYNKLLYIDLREFEFNILEMQPAETCKVCGTRADGPPQEVKDRFFEETCARDGRRNFVLSPNQRINIDLGKLEKLLTKKRFAIQSAGQFGTAFKPSKNIRACILKSGIMIAQTPPDTSPEIKDSVFDVYRSIMVDGLSLSADILPALE